MVLCIPVDSSPLYEDPAEVRSTDRPCALDICNTARSFTHESNTYAIRRWAFLILGCIDLLSCTPPPATLLCGSVRDVAEPGCGSVQVAEAPRMWQRPGFGCGIFRVAAAPGMWQRPGFGGKGGARQGSGAGKRSLAAHPRSSEATHI